jgi:hypothetical protein
VVVNREHYADGHDEIWMLADTKEVPDGGASRDDYRLRTGIEQELKLVRAP